MFTGVRYVLSENLQNLYRIYAIAKYELKADMEDAKLGFFWNIASPAIQIATYWFVFGYVFHRSEVDGIDYLSWLLGGMVMWFFIHPCITGGCSAVLNKINVITKMKFPVSILPATVIFKEAFNHICLLGVTMVLFILIGHYPSVHWLGLIYYLICAILFLISLTLVTSVLTMLARDVKKFVGSIIRLLMYLTPLFWNVNSVSGIVRQIIMANPLYYLVAGYRDCFFYHRGFLYYRHQMLFFWIWTVLLFCAGSTLMYKFRTRFIDMI